MSEYSENPVASDLSISTGSQYPIRLYMAGCLDESGMLEVSIEDHGTMEMCPTWITKDNAMDIIKHLNNVFFSENAKAQPTAKVFGAACHHEDGRLYITDQSGNGHHVAMKGTI